MKTLLFLIFLAVSGSRGLAQTALDMDHREAALNDQLNRINALELHYGSYRSLRDQSFYGNDGVYGRVANLNKGIRDWLIGWQSTLQVISDVNNFSDLGTRAQIKYDLDIKHQTILALYQDNFEILGT